MGGLNEKIINNVRFHGVGTATHFHSTIDSTLKVEAATNFFKATWEALLQALDTTTTAERLIVDNARCTHLRLSGFRNTTTGVYSVELKLERVKKYDPNATVINEFLKSVPH